MRAAPADGRGRPGFFAVLPPGVSARRGRSKVSYDYRMNKKAISVTLHPDNLLWLEARARATRSRSLSAALDAVVSEARGESAAVRSVVGRVRFPQGEAALEQGEKEIRRMFDRSLSRSHSSRRGRG